MQRIVMTVAIAALAAAMGVMVAVGSVAQTCQHIGSTTFCSNGLSSTQIGNDTYYSTGVTRHDIGPYSYYSNGLQSQQIGNTTYFNDGQVRKRIGDIDYYSNGRVCQTIGSQQICSPSPAWCGEACLH